METTGQMDWVALSSRAISLPIDLLGRYSQAEVQPYTLEFCKTLGCAFRNVTQDQLDACEKRLMKTKFKNALSSKWLEIGLGISIIPRQLAGTRGGVAFCTVASAIRSSFSRNYTGRVLHGMITKIRPDDNIPIPTNGQLELLCEEIVANGIERNFLDVVYAVSIVLQNEIKLNKDKGMPKLAPGFPLADELAVTILTLLSLDSQRSLLIEAEFEPICWIAAFSYYVLGQKVLLYLGNKLVWETASVIDGNRRHQNSATITLVANPRIGQDRNGNDKTTDIQLYHQANIDIIKLCRQDSREGYGEHRVWDRYVPLSQKLRELSVFTGEHSAKPFESWFDLETFTESLLIAFAARLDFGKESSYKHPESDHILVADTLTKDRLDTVLRFVFGSIGVVEKLEFQKYLETITCNLLDVYRVRAEQGRFSSEFRQTLKLSGNSDLILDIVLTLLFLEAEDYGTILVPRASWGNKCRISSMCWEGNENMVRTISYDAILESIFDIFGKEVAKINKLSRIGKRHRSESEPVLRVHEQDNILAASNMGTFAILPFITDLGCNRPLHEIFRLKLGQGSIYVNGHIASTIYSPATHLSSRGPEHAIQAFGAPKYGGQAYKRDGLHISRDLPKDSFNTSTLQNIALIGDLSYSLTPFINQSRATDFEMLWSLSVNHGYELLYDCSFNPLELVTGPDVVELPPHSPNRETGIIGEFDEDYTIYFTNVYEILECSKKRSGWEAGLRSVTEVALEEKGGRSGVFFDAMVVCCEATTQATVLRRLLAYRDEDAQVLVKRPSETIQMFCDRLVKRLRDYVNHVKDMAAKGKPVEVLRDHVGIIVV